MPAEIFMTSAPRKKQRAKTRKVPSPNPNHHLWRHGKNWWVYCAVNPTPRTKDKLRRSLCTESIRMARYRRDLLFQNLQAEGMLGRIRVLGNSGRPTSRTAEPAKDGTWQQRVDAILARLIVLTHLEKPFPVTVVGAGKRRLQLCC
ncbi:MAG: integrase [Verrucomicrobia bacterium]|nr:integrase [Verrucomicrobiota bacterium]